MDDVRGDFLRSPHGTTPAAVIGNKNKTDPLGAVSILTSSTSTSYSQQSISDYYWEALSGTDMKMMKMGDVKA